MEPSRKESGWMSVLDVSRTEERISHLRSLVIVLIGGAALWALIQGQLTGSAAVVVMVSLAVGMGAALVTLSVARTGALATAHLFANNAVDVMMMTGVLVAALQGSRPCSTLVVAAQLGYLLTIAVGGLRLHLGSSLFFRSFCHPLMSSE